MGRRSKWWLVGLALVAVALLARWGDIIDLMTIGGVREHKLTLWSNSGTPEFERRQAQDFMALHPDTAVKFNFAQSGSLSDAVFVSFLSGNPPDVLGVQLRELRDMVAAGMIRPLDDLLERQRREAPGLLDDVLGGDLRYVYFRCDPNDRFVRERERHPLEAARLLAMHGRLVGIAGLGGAPTLTYNKRLFRAAARMFPDAGLVDTRGEPVPPATWSEFLRVAGVITEFGRRSAEEAQARGETIPRVYGVIVQGRRPRDLYTRTLWALANAAGGIHFDFTGAGSGRGRFTYDHPAVLGAFRLALDLQREGVILPGTLSRDYEDVRSEVAQGSAAMLIDGWHAAMIGVQRNPWARDDIGSAPVPVPDAAIAERYGLPLRPGKVSRGGADSFAVITSSCRAPWQAWQWMNFTASDERQQKIGTRRGGLPGTFSAIKRLDDPEWFPFPYQAQAWRAIEKASDLWPAIPAHSPVRGAKSAEDLLHDLFVAAEARPAAEVMAQARDALAAYSTAVNTDYAARVAAGELDGTLYTFPDFDPQNPSQTLRRQQALARREDVNAEIAGIRATLPAELRDVTFSFAPANSALQALAIPGILLAMVLGFVAHTAWRNRRLPPLRRIRMATIRRSWHAYVFVLPALFMLTTFILYPAVYQFWLSGHEGNGITPLRWVGMKWYAHLAQDGVLWGKVIPNTFLYMTVVTAVQVPVALVIASLLNLRLRGTGIYRLLFFIPMVTSLSVVSVVFIGLLSGTDSGINQALTALGMQDLPYWLGLAEQGKAIDWLGDPRTGLWCVIAVGIWNGLPFTIILLLAGLQSIPAELFEAARVDGASAWQRFRHITIPALAPILVVVGFNVLLGASHVLGTVLVLTEGGSDHSSEVVGTYIFKWGFRRTATQEPDLGYATAIGIAYSLVLGVLTFINVRFIARRIKAQSGAAAGGAHG